MEQSAEATEGQVPISMHDEAEHGDTLAVFGTKEGIEGGDDARHFHYQPWLSVAAGGPLWALAEEVLASIPAPRVTPGRSLRKDATERRRLAVFSLLANLTVLALSPLRYESLLLSTHRGKGDRYNRTAAFSPLLLQNALLALEFLDVVSVTRGHTKRTRTEVSLSAGFIAKLQAHGITLAEVTSAGQAETVLLRQRANRGDASELVEYVDTAMSRRKRAQMEELNTYLSKADVRLDGQPLEPFHMVRIFLHDQTATPWTKHGRLYRGFHLGLKRGERHRLTIGGEELCDLDWSACFIHIAYGIAGAPFPSGDPYGLPGLAHCRDTVKTIMSALLSRRASAPGKTLPPFKLPRGTASSLPDGWNGKRFLQEAKAYHAPIAHLFETPDVWAQTSYTESEMMLEVLGRLRAEGCAALPCHDGLLCGKSFKPLAVAVMEAVTRERLGQAIPVTEKPIERPIWLN
ncbi:hypothetical protein FY134_10160 [Agrobacterium fabrum]|uniref:hypothetical protein n=1 Tax=Agrobacterium fabrum TaxID=1176649 RepID=UPI0013A6A16C|nr:hypothetical protein [Agrobacterium fabrum]UXT57990.1 hypothetical protein FY134_10160 [Agrobacterium fabrum]